MSRVKKGASPSVAALGQAAGNILQDGRIVRRRIAAERALNEVTGQLQIERM